MTNADKRRLTRNLCNSIRDEVARAVSRMPDEFDGHEIRVFLSEKFAHEVTELIKKRGTRRSSLRAWMAENWRAGVAS